MTPYIGQFLLNLAGLAALLPMMMSLKTVTLKRCYWGQMICISLAFLWLIYAHITSDFSLVNVISHSHTQKPWLYKIAGTWGNHEGSMLLWVVLLVLFGGLASKETSKVGLTRLILHSGLNLLFISFLLLVCDPFEAAATITPEGLDLNPLLQDPLLAIHPPFLYAGFVGFVVPFIYVMSHIFHQSNPSIWLPQMRSMVLIPWTLLSIGLGLGCFWAYYELGWGGWWFWDPVENTALIPWILGLLLLHSLFHNAHQHQTIRLIIVLSILTFISSLVGTLLVRSGLLISVHSFAVDPARGLLLLGLVSVVLIGSVLLVFNKLPAVPPLNERFISRSKLVRTAIILTFAALFTLVFGTLYPVLSAYLGYPLTVGAPYFQMTFIPMMIPIFCLLPFIPWLGWQQEKGFKTTIIHALPSLTLSGFLVILLWFNGEVSTFKEILFSWIAGWVMGSTLLSLQVNKLNIRFIGMSVAHFGIGLAILGMILSSAQQQEVVKALQVGETMQIASFQLQLEAVNSIKGPNYIAQQAQISLKKNQSTLSTLMPEKRFYWTKGIIHGETAIHSTWLSHVYVALGEQYEGNIWSVRVYYKPHINMLWLGMILIVGAGLLLIVSRGKAILPMLIFILQGSSFSMEAHEILPDITAEKRAMHVGRMILCPTCAGQNINDSAAQEAEDIRRQVRQLIRQGVSDTEILDHFVDQYGERILYQPALTIANMFLWGIPWGIFLFCLWRVWRNYQLRPC